MGEPVQLRRITGTQGCGVLGEFEWPNELIAFGDFNLVFGWNGTGKTTISSMLRVLETRTPQDDCSATLDFGSRSLSLGKSADFTGLPPARVFNRDFVAKNVFSDERGPAPIFFLGEATIRVQNELEELRRTRDLGDANVRRLQPQLDRAEDDLDHFCIERAGEIRVALRSPEPNSVNQFNNYNKTDFRRRMESLLGERLVKESRLPEQEESVLQESLVGQPMDPVSEDKFEAPDLMASAGAVSALIERNIAAQVISELQEDPELAHWTREGIRIHIQREAAICHFCGGRLSADRMAHLQGHFSEEYEELSGALKSVKTRIVRELETIRSFKPLLPSQLTIGLRDQYARQARIASEAIGRAEDSYEGLIEALETKEQNPFRSPALGVDVTNLEEAPFDELARLAARHNAYIEDAASRRKHARERIEAARCAAGSERFAELKTRREKLAAELHSAHVQNEATSKRIGDLENTLVDSRRPVEQLNQDIWAYLGHGELSFSNEGTGYSITRFGQPASRLSEGERTGIALLYFLQSLRDKDFELQRGIVVLDDPVSSLDANALFHAFGFIKERTKGAAQLFILTHNFAFFRQVRGWFDHVPGHNKKNPLLRPGRFYMLESALLDGKRRSLLRALDPLLMDYDSEYHYLFARVNRALSDGSYGGRLDTYYDVPNIARRLLEAFLAFRYPSIHHSVDRQLDRVDYDSAKKSRILRFLHVNSHNDHVDDPQHDPSVLAETPSILEDLFDLMSKEDPRHVAEMTQLVHERD